MGMSMLVGIRQVTTHVAVVWMETRVLALVTVADMASTTHMLVMSLLGAQERERVGVQMCEGQGSNLGMMRDMVQEAT